MTSLRVLTYNIRKGQGASGRSPHRVDELARALCEQSADLVLCQEVFHGRGRRAGAQQSDEIGAVLGMLSCYRPNKNRRIGHHGNATFSRWPVEHVENFDMTVNSIEKRGALYVRLRIRGKPLHVFNVHLSLNHPHREHQVRRLHRVLKHLVPDNEPVLLAGDFNDWRLRLDPVVTGEMGFQNAFAGNAPVQTWPARTPVLNLDRVYVRNLVARGGRRLAGGHWSQLSDHLPLRIDLAPATF
jgi:endonuclease/exonuclease/phosphatase family metal-dependent hydrolase